MMTRKPMSEVEAANHARRQLDKSAPYLNRNTVQTDQEAFRRIKAKVHTPNLARDILKGFEQVETLDEHRKR